MHKMNIIEVRITMAFLVILLLVACDKPNRVSLEPSSSGYTTSATVPEQQSEPDVFEDEFTEWGKAIEYGEFLAEPKELRSLPVNDIAKSMRLNAQAMYLGDAVYNRACADCHGNDLKGIAEMHTPDLTDHIWRFTGDDFASVGTKKLPSDVEWTVRHGIRTGSTKARGFDANMLAFNPSFRNEKDKEDFGTEAFLTGKEIDDVVEYVLQISGQLHNIDMANRGKILFRDNRKGNCYDCHGLSGTGIPTFGSTNLTRKDLYLYGADRETIRESIVKGRRTQMPAFESVLTDEEIKAVSIFVWHAAERDAGE